MNRDPIRALVQLAGMKVDQAQVAHARARLAVVRAGQLVAALGAHIVEEQALARSLAGPCAVLANHGIDALHQRLAAKREHLAGLEGDTARTLGDLRAAILTRERYALHQRRLREHRAQARARRETTALDDLFLGRSGNARRQNIS